MSSEAVPRASGAAPGQRGVVLPSFGIGEISETSGGGRGITRGCAATGNDTSRAIAPKYDRRRRNPLRGMCSPSFDRATPIRVLRAMNRRLFPAVAPGAPCWLGRREVRSLVVPLPAPLDYDTSRRTQRSGGMRAFSLGQNLICLVDPASRR